MNRIAFLSADNLEGYVIDDDLCYEPLRKFGWKVETISWRNAEVDWRRVRAAPSFARPGIIKGACRRFFRRWSASRPQHALANPIEIVRWNADKIYLHDLEKRGARIVPTIWKEKGIESRDAERWFDELETNELVLKPTVSANAESTARLTKGQVLPSALSAVFAGRPYMVQPFMRGIVDEGEFSLFYFRGDYSHAILKTPKPTISACRRNTAESFAPPCRAQDLLAAGEKVMRLLDASYFMRASILFVMETTSS